jgi:hypothetical protein
MFKPSRPSGEKSENWTAKSYVNSKNKLTLYFRISYMHALSLKFEKGNLQHFVLKGKTLNVYIIETLNIECVLLSRFSQNFVSTKWRIENGIFTRFRLLQ